MSLAPRERRPPFPSGGNRRAAMEGAAPAAPRPLSHDRFMDPMRPRNGVTTSHEPVHPHCGLGASLAEWIREAPAVLSGLRAGLSVFVPDQVAAELAGEQDVEVAVAVEVHGLRVVRLLVGIDDHHPEIAFPVVEEAGHLL